MFPAPLVITAPHFLPGETETLAALCDRFGCRIHLRKPQADPAELRRFIERLAALADPRLLTLHYDAETAAETGLGGFHAALPARPASAGQLLSRPLHRLEELDDPDYADADYVFLSPVFDSISKNGYRAAFDPATLAARLQVRRRPFDVVALGGISPRNIGTARRWGFDGAALLGALWSRYRTAADRDLILRLYEQNLQAWNRQ